MPQELQQERIRGQKKKYLSLDTSLSLMGMSNERGKEKKAKKVLAVLAKMMSIDPSGKKKSHVKKRYISLSDIREH